ncbi:class I SAM-dependent methyltransferase [Jeotgalibacillus soli]|uniref:Methyltransferase type 11 domain-containing protein n=1 Tax=Jeotgalibacillus soli TaxID=889306 RepID=A0A0C2W631_9BACL|nr:class I SAM-dependent methyltransferase [Jeotgalibacillus soli]KIL52011.1 hypothetical protein KP78_03810 [Jeotgalibacillus soli]
MSNLKKDQVKSVFSKNADAYVKSTTHSQGNDLEQMISWIQPEPNWAALDLATGGGHVAKLLAPDMGIVFATDLTKDMLQNTASYLKHFPNIHYVVADAEDIPFIDDTFDVIACRIAAHHFPHPERFIQEVNRVLKPGGKFLFIDNIAPEDPELERFMNTFEEMRDPSHARALPISEWEDLLTKNHLSILKSNHTKKALPFQNWVTRTLDNETQIKAVTDFFSSASDNVKQHFEFIEENNLLQSFSLDHWMVLCEKKANKRS